MKNGGRDMIKVVYKHISAFFSYILLYSDLLSFTHLNQTFSSKNPFFNIFLFLDILFHPIPVLKATFLLLQASSQRCFGPELKLH